MKNRSSPVYLGIEAGGTRTVALLVGREGQLLERAEFGPGNLRILDDRTLTERFQEIAGRFAKPASIGIGMAGLRDKNDETRLERVITNCWPGVPYKAAHDLETALRAAPAVPEVEARVIVLSGTGSCCYGRNRAGETAKLGGWGHIIGDKGSGYEIGLRALKAAVYYLDRDGLWTRLGERILRRIALNEPNQLIQWVQQAEKSEIAALAIEVFAAAGERDEIANDIMEGARKSLAKDGVSCAARLCQEEARVQFILAGSVLLKQADFARELAEEIAQKWPNSVTTPLERESAWGSVDLAREALNQHEIVQSKRPGASWRKRASKPSFFFPPLEASKAPTEQRNPRSRELHRMDAEGFIELMLAEERRVIPALLREKEAIREAVEIVAKALGQGGRLFYAGAGTSGRLGVLDASECPPTFRASPEQVQGIIAGGQRALWQAVEGAEDDPEAGAAAVRFRGVRRGDVLVGIAASGRTPFVWGAMQAAGKVRAKTILLCFNPNLEIVPKYQPDVLIAPNLGPEVLTGSTRLKSGTATKLVLNILSTYAMVRQGKVISNLMVDLNPSNVKLRDRAIRIVQELTGRGREEAERTLEANGWVVKKAWQTLGGDLSTLGRSRPGRRQSGRARSRPGLKSR